METALFFARLKVSEERKLRFMYIRYSRDISFSASHLEQLALLFEVAPTEEIVVWDSHMDAVLSAVLATRPYPISLTLYMSSIDMHAFIEHLRGRSTTFGSLAFVDLTTPVEDIRRIIVFASIFEHLRILALREN